MLDYLNISKKILSRYIEFFWPINSAAKNFLFFFRKILRGSPTRFVQHYQRYPKNIDWIYCIFWLIKTFPPFSPRIRGFTPWLSLIILKSENYQTYSSPIRKYNCWSCLEHKIDTGGRNTFNQPKVLLSKY